jgi:DNA-binding LacI/PurR family transcriptional regulator
MLEAQSRRWRVPHDVMLMGFGDFPLGRHLGAGLSTMRPPRREIGEAAARLILQRLDDPAAPATGLRLDCALIERGSTAR